LFNINISLRLISQGFALFIISTGGYTLLSPFLKVIERLKQIIKPEKSLKSEIKGDRVEDQSNFWLWKKT